MKKALFSILFVSLVAQAQAVHIIDIPNGYPNPEGLKFYISTVRNFSNSADIGFAFKGPFNIRNRAKLVNGIEAGLQNYFDTSIPQTSNKTPVSIIVKQFEISEKLELLREHAICIIALEFIYYNSTGVQYTFESYQTFSNSKGIDVTKHHPDNIHQCLIKSIKSFQNYLDSTNIQLSSDGNYNTSEINEYPNYSPPQEDVIYTPVFSQFITYISLGYNYRISPLAENLDRYQKEHYEGLLSGPMLSTGFTYYFHNNFGLGFKYELAYYKNSSDNFPFYDEFGNFLFYGPLKETININYFALSLSWRKVFNNGYFYYGISFGPVAYHDEATSIGKIDINALALGTSTDIGFNFSIDPNFGLGFELSYFAASFNEFTLDGQSLKLPNDMREGLARLEFTTGIRFFF